MKTYTNIQISLGNMVVVANLHSLEGLYFEGQKHEPRIDPIWHHDSTSKLFSAVSTQLQEYINGTREKFDIPYSFERGTDFQQKVWKALSYIPYGKTMSYQELAKLIEYPKATRAVAAAIGKNPLSLIIPCHRIIGSNGSLTGYAAGLELKKRLLTLEKALY